MKRLAKVLLIDDDQICNWLNRLLIEEMQLATQIDCLTDGQLAYEYLIKSCIGGEESSCPDLIFLDLNMPGLDGFQLLEKLHETPGCSELCRHRIVILSSSMHLADLMQAARYKIHTYLVKPLTKAKVNMVLETLMPQKSENSPKPAPTDVKPPPRDRKPHSSSEAAAAPEPKTEKKRLPKSG